MAQTFDLILSGGTVVNHDGVGLRDVGVRDGLIAEIGDLGAASAGERIDCARPARPAGRDRQPGAFPRARPDPQGGPRDGLARRRARRRHRRVRDAEHRPADDDRAEALADKVGARDGRMHCDFAFWVGGTHDNVADLTELERLPGAAGIKVFMGSSTGSAAGRRRRGRARDPARRPPPRRLPQRGRGAAQRAQAPARPRRSRRRIPSGATRSRRCAAPSG